MIFLKESGLYTYLFIYIRKEMENEIFLLKKQKKIKKMLEEAHS
jgi:hypothetical protein